MAETIAAIEAMLRAMICRAISPTRIAIHSASDVLT